MTSLRAIEVRMSSVRKYLRILRGYRKYSLETIQQDVTLKGAVERYLYLATQSSIDLAEAIISFKDLRRPSSYTEAFQILNEERFLSAALTGKLVKMAGFRNVIAHDYADLDFGIVYDVLQNRLKDIEAFLAEARKNLTL